MNFGYGFNMTWMVSTRDRPFDEIAPVKIEEKELDFIAKQGFNFIRLPLDYRFWVRDFSYTEPDDSRLAEVDRCVGAIVSRGLHCSLNIHRAPGYCVNRPEIEKHNLWKDREAQDGFLFQWTTLAKRFSYLPPEALSFDLLNEPPWDGEYGMTRASHETLMRSVVAGIRAVDPGRPIIVDGLGCGNAAIPELSDLGVNFSARGYQPMALTHYQASWCAAVQDVKAEPAYPLTLWEGKKWDRQALYDYYQPWRKLESENSIVHIGEFGCYNTVPNQAALNWFTDLLSIYKEYRWGYSLWNFKGPFGVVEHGREGTRWELIENFKVDRDLLELLKQHRC